VAITQDSDVAPAVVRVQGNVHDDGCCCGIESLFFDLGDGAVWASPQAGGPYHPVDIEWTYHENGIYTIHGVAISPDWCGSQVGERSWTIVVGPQLLTMSAQTSPGGPPFAAYLNTPDDVRPDQWVSSTVDWGDGVPESVDWYRDGINYRTPAHMYPDAGERTILASITYASGPAVTGTTTLDVGTTLATEATTWGRIKALYR
jgi:hypothetical protein